MIFCAVARDCDAVIQADLWATGNAGVMHTRARKHAHHTQTQTPCCALAVAAAHGAIVLISTCQSSRTRVLLTKQASGPLTTRVNVDLTACAPWQEAMGISQHEMLSWIEAYLELLHKFRVFTVAAVRCLCSTPCI
jgi:hypothetical protein